MRMYCRHCHEPQEIAWLDRTPAACPVCKLPTPMRHDWLQVNSPTVAWALTPLDQRFLRILAIRVGE